MRRNFVSSLFRKFSEKHMISLLTVFSVSEKPKPLPYIAVPLHNHEVVVDYFDFQFLENTHPLYDYFKNFKRDYYAGNISYLPLDEQFYKSKHAALLSGILSMIDIHTKHTPNECFEQAYKLGSSLAKCFLHQINNTECPKGCWACQLSTKGSRIDDEFIYTIINQYLREYQYRDFKVQVPGDADSLYITLSERRLKALLRKEIQRGNSVAQYEFAKKLLIEGEKKAAIHMLEAIDKSNVPLAYGLLGLILNGTIKGDEYYNKGAQIGDPISATELALKNLNNPLSHTAADATKLLRLAAEGAYPRAMAELGYGMLKGKKGFDGSREEGINLLLNATENYSYIPALYYLYQAKLASFPSSKLSQTKLADFINRGYDAYLENPKLNLRYFYNFYANIMAVDQLWEKMEGFEKLPLFEKLIVKFIILINMNIYNPLVIFRQSIPYLIPIGLFFILLYLIYIRVKMIVSHD